MDWCTVLVMIAFVIGVIAVLKDNDDEEYY